MTERIVRVDVTTSDIAAGKPVNCQRCPVALAVKRACDAVEVKVNLSHISVLLESGWWEGRHTTETAFFIMDFDDHEFVQPFSFDLGLEKAR